jgi:hypothetical protein
MSLNSDNCQLKLDEIELVNAVEKYLVRNGEAVSVGPREDPPDAYVTYQDGRRVALEVTQVLFNQIDKSETVNASNFDFVDQLNARFRDRIPPGIIGLVHWRGLSKNSRKLRRDIAKKLEESIQAGESGNWLDIETLNRDEVDYSIHWQSRDRTYRGELVCVSMGSKDGYSSDSVDSLIQHIFCTKAHKMRKIRGQKWIAIAPGWLEKDWDVLQPAIRQHASRTGFSRVFLLRDGKVIDIVVE